MKAPSIRSGVVATALLCITACSSAPADEAVTPPPPPVRAVAIDSYPSVGGVRLRGERVCSGVILRHGVFATARHCFRENDAEGIIPRPRTVSLVFGDGRGILSDGLMIAGVNEVSFDPGLNDLAYVFYDAAFTKGHVTIDSTSILRKVPAPGTSLTHVGYPAPAEKRLVTKGCHRLAREGAILKKNADPGYIGTVYDTDCMAWYGNSGGPFFELGADGSVKGVVGVATHTFETDKNGIVLGSAQASDEFGELIKTINFSSFQDAEGLDAALARGDD